MASKELESSKQQVAEACSFGSGKHREFAPLAVGRTDKKTCVKSWKKVLTCRSAEFSKNHRRRQSRHPYARRLTGSDSTARRVATLRKKSLMIAM